MVSGATRRAVSALPPSWFIDKGYLMKLKYFNLSNPRALRIEGSAAHVIVMAAGGHPNWKVSWWVGHGSGDASGNINMSTEMVARCFGLSDGLGKSGSAIGNKILFNFDAAEQGAFVREQHYLNIPGPAATGLPGDPCVSVWLSEEIKRAVQELITAK